MSDAKHNSEKGDRKTRKKRIHRVTLFVAAGTVVCAIAFLFFSTSTPPPEQSSSTPKAHTLGAKNVALLPPELTFDAVNQHDNKVAYIAHAFGEINGNIYTNSLEAFKLNYSRGFRVFECDFVYLKDGTVFVAHDAHEAEYGMSKPFTETTKDDVAHVRQEGTYTPLMSKDIVKLMRQHPDMLLMLDTKMNHVDIIRQLVKDAAGDSKVLDRMIPHISDQNNYDAVMSAYHFKYTMLALYRMLPLQPSTEDQIVEFVQKNHITAVMMNRKEDDPTLAMINNGDKPGTFSFMKLHTKLQGARIPHYVHSVGNKTELEKFRALGVGAYMDIPLPQ